MIHLTDLETIWALYTALACSIAFGVGYLLRPRAAPPPPRSLDPRWDGGPTRKQLMERADGRG